jgi:hypothetical protein
MTLSHATTTEQDLTCMIEGCDAIGEEVIGLLDEASLLENVDKYDELTHDVSPGDDFENNEEDNLIPAVVCGNHFDKIVEACYCQEPSKVIKNKQIKVMA